MRKLRLLLICLLVVLRKLPKVSGLREIPSRWPLASAGYPRTPPWKPRGSPDANPLASTQTGRFIPRNLKNFPNH
jgi:hypothetical protein